jgi:hypothetical protein
VNHGGGSDSFEWQRCSAVGGEHTFTGSREGGGVSFRVVGQHRWRKHQGHVVAARVKVEEKMGVVGDQLGARQLKGVVWGPAGAARGA